MRLGSYEPREYEVFAGEQLVGYVRRVSTSTIQFGTYVYWRAYDVDRRPLNKSDYLTRRDAAAALEIE